MEKIIFFIRCNIDFRNNVIVTPCSISLVIRQSPYTYKRTPHLTSETSEIYGLAYVYVQPLM